MTTGERSIVRMRILRSIKSENADFFSSLFLVCVSFRKVGNKDGEQGMFRSWNRER